MMPVMSRTTEGDPMLALTEIKARAAAGAAAWDAEPACDPYPMAESMADVPVLVAEVERLRAQVISVIDLAEMWGTQATDYDVDTETQIADGRQILVLLRDGA